MNLSEYQHLAARTLPKQEGTALETNMLLGIGGEAGELQNKAKKRIFHGHMGATGEIAEELGDILWYVAGLATAYGLNLNDVASMNIAKLRARYPAGFSTERSRNRDVEHEIVSSIWDDEAETYAAQMGFTGATE